MSICFGASQVPITDTVAAITMRTVIEGLDILELPDWYCSVGLHVSCPVPFLSYDFICRDWIGSPISPLCFEYSCHFLSLKNQPLAACTTYRPRKLFKISFMLAAIIFAFGSAVRVSDITLVFANTETFLYGLSSSRV